MKDNRPVNLDLSTMHFPITAIVSILHRISGVLMFLLIPFLLCLLSCSLSGQTGFDKTLAMLSSPLAKCVLFFFLAPFIYHSVAGVKHLLADWGVAEEKCSAKMASRLTLLVAVILIVLMGIWIW